MNKPGDIPPSGDFDPRISDVLAGMPVGVSWANLDSGDILFINRKLTEMFGYTLDDLSTISVWIDTVYANPDQASKIREFWASQEGIVLHEQDELEGVEVEIRCADGSIKTALTSKIILPGRGGALTTFIDITPRKELELKIRQQAMEDPLTGLLNRRAFSEILEARIRNARATRQRLALLMLDLDNFKEVNDTLGHDQGDVLLQNVTARLRSSVKRSDSFCRLGGDEFCIVLDQLPDKVYAEAIAERIVNRISRPYTLADGHEVEIGASLGIALLPEQHIDERGLMKLADAAMYRAKNSGKGKWSY